MDYAGSFIEKIANKNAVMAVIGMGYVGFPLAVEIALKGFHAWGVDSYSARIAALTEGKNHIPDVDDQDFLEVLRAERFQPTMDYSVLREADAVIICVPTPLDRHQQPDISFIESAARSIAPHIKTGSLIILESTTYPGTTEGLLRTELERGGKKAGKKIVFVNFSGSAIALTPETKNCDVILQAWYPGQEGGTAIANVLFGDYNPAGRLPVTFYKSTDQLPGFEDYSMKGRTYRYMTETPLFPFGHGLSYTTFEYKDASLSASEIKGDELVTLAIPVSNTGERNGEEVVQVYVRRLGDKEGPSHTLRAFKRVAIAKGSTNIVTLSLNKESFEWFDTETNTMRPIEGSYEILYGGTSDVKQLKAIPVSIR